jgi:hypothetical protein
MIKPTVEVRFIDCQWQPVPDGLLPNATSNVKLIECFPRKKVEIARYMGPCGSFFLSDSHTNSQDCVRLIKRCPGVKAPQGLQIPVHAGSFI